MSHDSMACRFSCPTLSGGTVVQRVEQMQKLHNNLGQVVHTCVLLTPSSITWYLQGAVMLCGYDGNRRPGGK